MNDNLPIRTLLYVEDDDSLREMGAMYIRSLGYKVLEARNVESGSAILASEHVHAVLCDIVMPESTGLDLLKALRLKGEAIPFVFVTGYDQREFMLEALRLGATDFIQKPFVLDELAEAIHKVLDIGVRLDRSKEKIREAAKDAPSTAKAMNLLEKDQRYIERLSAFRRAK